MDTNGTDTVRRVLYFNHQLLQVQDFADEQAYHIRMRRAHNRLMHSWGVLEGLELHLDTRAQRLTVEEGTALDSRGCEIVLPREEQFELSPYAGRTMWVTIAYREQNVGGEPPPARSGFSRVEEVPALTLDESPPSDPGLRLVLGRLHVADDGTATLDEGEVPNRRRNAGGAGGDLEGRALTLSSAGDHPTTWPRLRMSAQHTVEVEGSLDVTGALSAGEGLRIGGGAIVAGPLGVGTTAPEGTLHVIDTPRDANGTTLVLGPTTGSNLRLGYHQDYSWIQSHGLRPLRINEMGNDVSVGSRLGLGTHQPSHPLHVAGEDAVALFESRGSSAYLRVSTREGIDNRVELANRPGGRLALWVAGGGDVVNVTRDGRLGVGTDSPTHRFHVRADDAVGLFESIGEQAYLRVSTREGMDYRVELANRPGGRLALWTARGGDALNVTREGAVGIGTQQPQARLHVAGDLVVDGEIRSRGGGGRGWASAVNGLAFPGSIGIGTAEPRAKLHLLHTPQDSNGDALQIGDENGSNLRLGYHQDYSWIQSHGLRPLRVNEMGNDVLFNLGGGNVGIGTAPTARLHVKGDVFVEGAIRTPAGELVPGGGGGGGGGGIGTPARIDFSIANGHKLNLWKEEYAIGIQHSTQYFRTSGNFAWFRHGVHADGQMEPGAGGTGMMVLNSEGRLGLGTTAPRARLEVAGGAIMPAAGNDEQSGILFPPDAGGGAADRAYLRYYSRSGKDEAMTLELGIQNDGDDHIALMPSGNVGVGTTAPTAKLHVKGDLFIEGTIRTAAGELRPGGEGGAVMAAAPNDGGIGRFDRIDFGSTTSQKLNLWGEQIATGVQDFTQYQRSSKNFAWFLGGAHDNGELNPGTGGRVAMVLREGRLGVGTTGPRAAIEVAGGAIMPSAGNNEQSGILFPPDAGGGAADRAYLRYYSRSGKDEAMTLELGIQNDGDDHIALMPAGSLGVGITAPTHRLHVKGPENIALLESTGTQAYIRVSTAEGMDNRVEFCNRPGGRLALWTAGAGDGFNVLRDGRTGVGTTTPEGKLQVINAPQDSNGTTLILGPMGGANLRMGYHNDYSWIQAHGLKPLRINEMGNDVIVSPGGGNVGVGTLAPAAKMHVKGNMIIEGNLEVRGSKGGYLADQFVNATGETLEEGDVVVIGAAQTTLFYGYGETRNIPIPEVDPAEKTADARVCGVVAAVYGFDDSGEGLAPVSTARRKRGDAPAPGADVAAEDGDPRQVGPGQRGMMVTVGAFAHCKVDADLGAIEVGDLLTTSPTRGHAQKVTDPAQAIGAIIGKALAPLKKGQGKIPVMVMLQ